MHPILTDAWATDRHRELLLQAAEWRRTQPRQVLATDARRASFRVTRFTQRFARSPEALLAEPAMAANLQPATLPAEETPHDGRSLSRI